MNRYFYPQTFLCVVLSLVACSNRNVSSPNQKHEAHAYVHEQYDVHAHAHSCEGHNHSHESNVHSHDVHEHKHEVEAHNHAANEHSHGDYGHAAEGHSHDAHAHGDGIAFSKQQAEAAGLCVEVVEEQSFYGVIKTAGHIQVPVGQEAMVVAASSGRLLKNRYM